MGQVQHSDCRRCADDAGAVLKSYLHLKATGWTPCNAIVDWPGIQIDASVIERSRQLEGLHENELKQMLSRVIADIVTETPSLRVKAAEIFGRSHMLEHAWRAAGQLRVEGGITVLGVYPTHIRDLEIYSVDNYEHKYLCENTKHHNGSV